MKPRELRLLSTARADLRQAVALVRRDCGDIRADKFLARIEAFVRRLAEFSDIGTRHDHFAKGLRLVGIPGLRRISVVFRLTDDTVTVLRIGYLGQDVTASIPGISVENPILVAGRKK